MSNEELQSLVNDHVSKLGEHFDSVQIFCTVRKEDGTGDTIHVASGGGNWYARFGQVVEWVDYQNHYVAAKAKSDFKEERS